MIFTAILATLLSSLQAYSIDKKLCLSLTSCIEKGDLCTIIQIPQLEKKKITESEAYGDAVDRFSKIVSTRKDFHFFSTTEELSSYLSGLSTTKDLRMIFVGHNGQALEDSNLYLDDISLVDAFFKAKTPPSISPLSGTSKGVLKVTLQARCLQ